jgi:hypothetical protein
MEVGCVVNTAVKIVTPRASTIARASRGLLVRRTRALMEKKTSGRAAPSSTAAVLGCGV